MIKDLIKKDIFIILKNEFQLDFVQNDIVIEIPKQSSLGDFSTNVSFMLAKRLKKSPLAISEDLAMLLQSSHDYYRCESVKGFLNIFIKDSFLWNYMNTYFNQKPEFSKLGDHILLEYVSANPTGPLHVGHGRWAVLGSALANLFSYTSQTFKTENYINDAGNQIQLLHESVTAVKENQPIPEKGYHGDYIKDIAKQNENPVKAILNQQKETLLRLNVTFDTWYSERSLYENKKVEHVLRFLKDNNLSYIQDEACWFKSTQFGDDKDRVLIKSDKSYTYFLVDLAYHFDKMNRDFDYLINIWGADHHGYVPRVKAGIQAFSDNSTNIHLDVVIGQLVNLFRAGEAVRMSKRTGQMITLDEVIDDIGADATTFFLLHKSADSTIDFDLDLAKQKNSENPVFYVQYAHARMVSLLSKFDFNYEQCSFQKLDESERQLLKSCLLFYDVVWDSTVTLSPYKLTQYCQKLAKLFHSFYEHCPIKGADLSVQYQRLNLVAFTKKILKKSLNLCGISAPDSM